MGHNYGIYFTFPFVYNLRIYIPTFICGCDVVVILFSDVFCLQRVLGPLGATLGSFTLKGAQHWFRSLISSCRFPWAPWREPAATLKGSDAHRCMRAKHVRSGLKFSSPVVCHNALRWATRSENSGGLVQTHRTTSCDEMGDTRRSMLRDGGCDWCVVDTMTRRIDA